MLKLYIGLALLEHVKGAGDLRRSVGLGIWEPFRAKTNWGVSLSCFLGYSRGLECKKGFRGLCGDFLVRATARAQRARSGESTSDQVLRE